MFYDFFYEDADLNRLYGCKKYNILALINNPPKQVKTQLCAKTCCFLIRKLMRVGLGVQS